MNTLYIILASLILFFILGHFHRRKRAKSTGAHIAVEYPERCTACGDCVTVCKFNALELIDRSNKRNNR